MEITGGVTFPGKELRGMIEYKFMRLPKELYLGLRASVGWKSLSDRQVHAALHGCKAMITAWDTETGEVVGMGRLVGDELVIMNIQDLIVRPDYHGRGIGSELIRYLKERKERIASAQ